MLTAILSGMEDQVGFFKLKDFPGGPVVKNPPASAGDMGSIPELRRFHRPRGTSARVPQLLSLRSRAREFTYPRACALQQEEPLQGDGLALQLESRLPLAATGESLRTAKETPHSQKQRDTQNLKDRKSMNALHKFRKCLMRYQLQ